MDDVDDVLDERIIKFLQVDRDATQKQMSKELGTSLASIQRAIKRLTESGRIERKGGKRFGYWEVK